MEETLIPPEKLTVLEPSAAVKITASSFRKEVSVLFPSPCLYQPVPVLLHVPLEFQTSVSALYPSPLYCTDMPEPLETSRKLSAPS